jgi:segregation and condensation protein A
VLQLDAEIDFRVNLEVFDGPFDLLLRLIGKHELDITQVALAKVTDEFIAYVKQLDLAAGMDSASEFLVVAATLLDLKIASLLPAGEVVDAEDVALLEARDLLFARLLQYRAYKQVAQWFETGLDREAHRIARAVRLEERFREMRPELVWTLSPAEFAALAEQALTPKEIPGVGLTHLHAPRISIREQAQLMITRLRKSKKLSFRELIADAEDRAVLVARFLGVLELYRLGAVGFETTVPLADFTVSFNSELTPEQLGNLGAEFE